MQTPINIEPSEREKIAAFLKSNPVGVLATVDETNSPHASTIYITSDDNLTITFTTKRDTQKYGNISRNNKVMLVSYDAANQSAVQITGRAIEVNDPQAQQDIYYGTLHAAQQTGEDVVPPIAKIPAGPYVGFKIEIENIWMSDYGWGNSFARALEHAGDPHGGGDPA